MKTTQQRYQMLMRGLILSLLILIGPIVANAQDAGKSTTHKPQGVDKTLSEVTDKDSVAITSAENAEMIKLLVRTIKDLQTEIENLQRENKKVNAETAERLKAMELRLSKIERRNAGNKAIESPAIRAVRSPRYDRAYNTLGL